MRTQDEIEKKLEQLGTKRIELREKKSMLRNSLDALDRDLKMEDVALEIDFTNAEINALKWCLGQSDIL